MSGLDRPAATQPPPAPWFSSVVVAVLTLNEAENIGACLDSVSSFPRRVVLDSGSTDATVAEAEARGARVIVNRQPGAFDIAAQRNHLLDHPDFDDDPWFLFLDADERMTRPLEQEILAVLRAPQHAAYVLTPKYLFEGRWMRRCLGYPNWHPRFVRRGGARFVGGVWEHFDTRDVGTIEEPYLHHGNSKGFSDWVERHDRYSTWEAAKAVTYLRSGSPADFGTERSPRLRAVAARGWRARPLMRFLWMYVWRRGFLDGPSALRFCLRYSVYEYMIVQKIHEDRRRAQGKPL